MKSAKQSSTWCLETDTNLSTRGLKNYVLIIKSCILLKWIRKSCANFSKFLDPGALDGYQICQSAIWKNSEGELKIILYRHSSRQEEEPSFGIQAVLG